MRDSIPRDYEMGVGWNQAFGHRRIAALGNNPACNAGEDLWTFGGAYPWKAAVGAMEVFCANAADTSAGTGARSVLVNGLDADFNEVSQTVLTNGGVVALPTPLLRVNSALIMSAGTGGVNAGDINIRDAGGGTVRAVIPAGFGITRQAVYTVPAGHTLQITSMLFTFNEVAGGNKFARFATFSRSAVGGFYRLPLELAIGDEPPYRHDGEPGIPLPEKTDFAIRCTATSAADVNLTAAILGIIKRNDTP